MIPPMNEVASYILKDMFKRYLVGETAVMKKARQLILRSNGREGQFLTESAPYFLARMGGQGGARTEGKPILPPGVTSLETAYKEGFRTGGTPVIVPMRDYPGLDTKQIADLFSVQARDLYRIETRNTTNGPDLTALVNPAPQTVRNLEAQDKYDDRLLERLRLMRTSYANSVLPCIEMSIPDTKCVNFTEARGRHPELTTTLELGSTNTATGLCLPKQKGNMNEEIFVLEVSPDGVLPHERFLQGCLDLTALIESQNVLAMLCTKGRKALVYVAGGNYGRMSRNQMYDFLATKGKQTGGAAPNSKVAYKNIKFENYRVVISRESFALRDGDVTLLPLSLDIKPSKARESTTTAFENSNNFDNDSGLVILPIVDLDFVPGYDDHPSVVQHRMGFYVPTLITFLRNALIAHQEKESVVTLVSGDNEWNEMRNSNSRVKEGDDNDLIVATDVFAIPYGHEVVLIWDGKSVVMGIGPDKYLTGTPQTNDLELFSNYLNLEPYAAKGILTPTDSSTYTLIDKALSITELTDDADMLNALHPLQVEIYGFEDTIGPFRPLAMPHAKVCRNQTDSFADISERQGDLTFSEMIQDELDSGLSDRILIRFENAPERNLYPIQMLDAAVIGFDIAGKNPQNGIVGNIVLGLSSLEKVKIRKGGRGSNTNSEIYNPIGVVGAFLNYTVSEKKALLDLLLDAATHPGYKDGYMLVEPEKLNLIVRIAHKGIENYKSQPALRLVTEVKPFTEKTISYAPTMYDGPGEVRGEPGTNVFDRAQFGSRPEGIPGQSMLFDIGERNLPVLRSPSVVGFVGSAPKVFADKVLQRQKASVREKFSKINQRLTMKVPLQQIPIRNPLGGPEPMIDDSYDRPLDVPALLTLSMNPPFSIEHIPRGEKTPRFPRFERKHRFLAVDDETDHLVGILVADMDSSNIYITAFDVQEDMQRQGIGSQLLQALVERFPTDEIVLHRHPRKIPDEKLKSLYLRFGFTEMPYTTASGLQEMRRRPS
jgi:GNAT superfamily N-acetyltransferase